MITRIAIVITRIAIVNTKGIGKRGLVMRQVHVAGDAMLVATSAACVASAVHASPTARG